MKKFLLLTAMLLSRVFSFGQNYCIPSYSTNDLYNYYISSVQILGGWDGTTSLLHHYSPKSLTGYSNFSDLPITVISSGGLTWVTVTIVNQGGDYIGVKGIIDLNRDGIFSNDEILLSDFSQGNIFSGAFYVPDNISSGPLRLRIILSQQSPISACGPFINGEVEDYTLYICKKPNVPSSISVCPNSSYSLTSSGAAWNSFWAYHPADHSPAGEISINNGTSTTVTGRVGRTSTKYWLWASSYGCDNSPYEINVTVINCNREGDLEEVKQVSTSLIENILEITNPNIENLFVSLVAPDGKVIFQRSTGEEKTSFDVHHLYNGIYLLHMTTSTGEHINKKIVINK